MSRHHFGIVDRTTASSSHSLPAGNNRSGAFIALLLLLLNVRARHIVTAYTLSDVGLAATHDVNVSRLVAKGAFTELGEVEAKKKCERMVGARRESIEALLAEMERRWGGADRYFLDVARLTENEVGWIRELLTAEVEGDLSHWSEANDLAS
ncbi:hypothetical protein BDU57DRAFT_170201 [Ampelomyces quisqualis]|uniref:Tyrosine phosphatase family-domain-containing protein n=1 Tax=Ampelomyces quisqualis TaxID=50730 RepID=A0A6A5QQB3_AMPQU|nr:hypothetical protein BDU57DRAFT_170201 [Ampelomyces quisqualis]